MRSLSSQDEMEKGLSYRFKLNDLHKYSQRLHYKDINWKLKLSALGKKIPDIKERKKILFKCSHFSTLLKVLKNTDWSQTPVYYQFLRNGRWKHEDDRIYSEVELQYHISSLNKMLNIENTEEMNQTDAKGIHKLYYDKTMNTLEVLMNQLNMMYYYEKVRVEFADQDVLEIDQLEKLMSRCLKLYQLLDSFVNIFKLIHKKEVSKFSKLSNHF